MTKQEQIEIEQFGRDIRVALEQGDFSHLKVQERDRFLTGRTYTATAEELYNASYRKIPENAVVITNEEYQMLKQLEKHHITCEDVYEYVELARKETAEKFLNMIYWRAVKHIKGNNKDECFIEISFEKLDELAKQFGVEVEE